MNYTHEKPVISVSIFEVISGHQKGEEASFTLYEDEGEDLGYQRDEFAKLPFASGRRRVVIFFRLVPVKEKGMQCPLPETLFSVMYLKTAPKGVTVQGKKVKKVKPERLEENPDDDTESMVWSWDKRPVFAASYAGPRGRKSDFPAFMT